MAVADNRRSFGCGVCDAFAQDDRVLGGGDVDPTHDGGAVMNGTRGGLESEAFLFAAGIFVGFFEVDAGPAIGEVLVYFLLGEG